MYSVSVTRSFTAWHYLIGGDFGPENERNSHDYGVEARLEGPGLDEHGYLVDITAVRAALDEVESRYAGNTLNDFAEFDGLNPSVEHFARILWEFIADRIPTDSLTALTVRIREDDDAWASYGREFSA